MINETKELSGSIRYIRTADAVLRCVAGEHLLVPIRSGQLLDAESLYILDDVGAYVWNALADACTVQELVNGIHDVFDVPEGQDVDGDLDELLDDLIAQGLIAVGGES